MQVFIDGAKRMECVLKYPSLSEPISYCTVSIKKSYFLTKGLFEHLDTIELNDMGSIFFFLMGIS